MVHCRLGQRLNIDDERTPESTLYEALEIGSENWPPDVTLIDYTTTESGIMKQLTGGQFTWGHPPHTHFWWQPKKVKGSGQMLLEVRAYLV